MDQRKPISFLSLKCIIQYMNVNFRTLNAPKFPSLRNIHRMIPLKLDFLKLDEVSFTIERTTHSFYIMEDYLDEYKLLAATVKQVCGYRGNRFDVTENGFMDITQALMAGDIVIGEPKSSMVRALRLRTLESLHGRNVRTEPEEFKPYVFYIIDSGKNSEVLAGRSPYGVKIRDTIRKKLDEVLGGTRVHHVKHLEIGTSQGILRLPKGLKLKTQGFIVPKNGNASLDAILPIIDASSFPLENLSITVDGPDDPIFQNEILRTSKSLNIKNKRIVQQTYANVLITLTNSKIHFTNDIDFDDIVTLAQNWVAQSREIGTRLSIQSVSPVLYLEWFYEMLNPADVIIPERRCSKFSISYTLPMNTTSELNIYGYESPNHEEERTLIDGQPYMIVMEVMPIGSAQPR